MAIRWSIVWLTSSVLLHSVLAYSSPLITGGRVQPLQRMKNGDVHEITYKKRSVTTVRPELLVKVLVFGSSLDKLGEISFHLASMEKANCSVTSPSLKRNWAYLLRREKDRVEIEAEFPSSSGEVFHMCIRELNTNTSKLSSRRLVSDPSTWVISNEPDRKYHLSFFWVQVAVLAVLLAISGLFSGLNLGLMALTPTELNLIKNSGSETERRYAGRILPVRERGNLLLCTLLIGNVIVNSAITILFDDLTTGFVSLVVSSAGIVIVGEIFPQSLCVKKGLAVGANTIWVTRFFIVLLFPIAYPISKILDLIFREEVRSYDRKRLMELMKMSDSMQEEVKIALGAMQIIDKTVADVMTKIDAVFMLSDTTVLNAPTVSEILRMGYMRIPVYEGDRNHIVSLLLVKDLLLIDPDDNATVKMVCGYNKHPLRFVGEQTPLPKLLEEFRKGEYHLAFVERKIQRPGATPYHKLIGVTTLEDIVEEIIQVKILDETDIDNVNKQGTQAHAIAPLIDDSDTTYVLSEQFHVTILQWLTSNLRAFHPDLISTSVLERFIRKHCKKVQMSCFPETHNPKTAVPRIAKLYTKKQFSDKFILVLEGKTMVHIGQEAMGFEAGPWHAFGIKMLDQLVAATQEPPKAQEIGFVPDFSAVVRGDCTFFEMSSVDWMSAFRSSEMARTTHGSAHSSRPNHSIHQSSGPKKSI